MLSESDQLISQTSPHVAPTPTATREIEEQKSNYFQRIATRSKQQLRSPEGQQISTTIPEEPLIENPEELSAIKTTYHFVDYILSSEKASSDTLAFVDTIQQVRQGIGEATRLYVSPAVSSFFDAYPNKQTWAMECLQEAQHTLNDIGTDMDSTWGREEDGGKIASRLKFEWGLKNKKRLLKRQQHLNQCHIHLMGAIHVMQTAELCNRPGAIIQSPIYEAPVRPLVLRDERDTFRGPYSRQKHRLGYNYASMSSLTLASENDEDDIETASINSTPVELAGSTPSELSQRQNVHDFLSFQTSRDSLTDIQSSFRRPRAASDHVERTAIGGVRSHASIDSMMGHHDYIPFTPSAIGIPMGARRSHATSVGIQSHNEEYESQAQQSYVVKNQPSFGDKFNDYILPNTIVKRLPSEDWASLPTRSGPFRSLPKCLTIGHPVHAVQGAMTTPGMATNSAPRPIEEPNNNPNALKQLPPDCEEPVSAQRQGNLEPVASDNTCTSPESHKMFGDETNSTKVSPYRSSFTSTSQSSVSSLTLAYPQDEGLACRSSGQRPSQRKSKHTPDTVEGRPESATTSREIEIAVQGSSQLSVESPITNKKTAGSTETTSRLPPPPMIVIDDACMPILATETELPEDMHEENVDSSVFQWRSQGEVVTNPAAERQSFVRPIERFPGPEQPRIELLALKDLPSPNGQLEPLAILMNNPPAAIPAKEISAARADESREDLIGNKPMSAQAKRRAAHARRMHLAFGNIANT